VNGFAARVPSFEPRALSPGTRLGKHEIIRRLAVGGMAELYLARAIGIEGFEKLVVIKRVHPHLASDADFIRMFLNEAKLAAALDHPNVTQVMDIGVADGEHYFTMEYLHGADLRELLQRSSSEGGLPLECGLEIVLGVARGLHHAHERCGPNGRPLGLVHRDVSPSNVFVTYEGGVKVVDFGIAKAGALTMQTRAGTLKGKIGYMSPEQCRGDAVDRRSDVFALGILLYEITTGRRLYFADSHYAILNKIIEGRFTLPCEVDPEYPAELEAIVRRALDTDPDERFPTAEAFQAALEDFVHEARIRCSTSVLARYVETLLGERPYPTAHIPMHERAVRSGATDVMVPPMRSGHIDDIVSETSVTIPRGIPRKIDKLVVRGGTLRAPGWGSRGSDGGHRGPDGGHRGPDGNLGRDRGTDGYPRVPDGSALGTDGYPRVPDGSALGTGGYPRVPDGSALGTGGYPHVPDGSALGTGVYPRAPDGDRRTRLRGLWAYGLVGVVALGVGLSMGGVLRSSSPDEREADSAPAEPSAEASATPGVAGEPSPAADGVLADESESDDLVLDDEVVLDDAVEIEPELDAEAGAEDEAGAEVEAAAVRKRKRKVRVRGSKSPGDEPRPRKSLYPPSYYE